MIVKRYILNLISILVLAGTAAAQLELTGSLDVEISVGGKDSQFITNEINNEFRKPHVGIHQFNLFIFAPIDESFFVNARLQMDTWGSGKLNNPRLTIASLTWERENSPIRITVGRFINPFGLYPQRQLTQDNPFNHVPLAYGYFVNISEIRGFWPRLTYSGNYGSDDVGLNTVYFGGYTNGLLFNWEVIRNILVVDVAASNVAIASSSNYTNRNNYAGIVRLGFQPFIFWNQGISVSYGTFMQRDEMNQDFEQIEKYNQLVIGTDLILSYSYFEISGEFIYSSWKVPGFSDNAFKLTSRGELAEFSLENYSYYIDLKIEPPFLPGSYLAARYDRLSFIDFDHPQATTRIDVPHWDNDVKRYTVAIGYKLSRSVLLKLSYMDQKTDWLDWEPDDYAYRAILNMTF